MTTVYIVDAFTRAGSGGNAAGVVVDAAGLSETAMLGIAGTLGFSETAFVVPSSAADHRVRFFTPEAEVNLCGHATIATYHLLGEVGRIVPGTWAMETRSGIQRVTYDESGVVSMTQNKPEFGAVIEPACVAPALGLAVGDICQPEEMPIQIASTGLLKIFVPVVSEEVLARIEPDLKEIDRISREYGAIGMYVYCLKSQPGVTARCRNFAPVVGIQEDSATGTSAAALSCLLYEHGKVDSEQCTRLCYEQGDAIGQPSEIRVALSVVGRTIEEVRVAGRANTREPRDIAI